MVIILTSAFLKDHWKVFALQQVIFIVNCFKQNIKIFLNSIQQRSYVKIETASHVHLALKSNNYYQSFLVFSIAAFRNWVWVTTALCLTSTTLPPKSGNK